MLNKIKKAFKQCKNCASTQSMLYWGWSSG